MHKRLSVQLQCNCTSIALAQTRFGGVEGPCPRVHLWRVGCSLADISDHRQRCAFMRDVRVRYPEESGAVRKSRSGAVLGTDRAPRAAGRRAIACGSDRKCSQIHVMQSADPRRPVVGPTACRTLSGSFRVGATRGIGRSSGAGRIEQPPNSRDTLAELRHASAAGSAPQSRGRPEHGRAVIVVSRGFCRVYRGIVSGSLKTMGGGANGT
jgi:hypothetical protein